MKPFVSFLALPFSVLTVAFAASPGAALNSPVAGVWQGYATVRERQVPITLRIAARGSTLKLELLNGPADHPEVIPASSATFDGTHLVAAFNYFARTLNATLAGGSLAGTYGASHATSKTPSSIAFQATRRISEVDPGSAPNAPNISGSWEIATKSPKGESAWEFRAEKPSVRSHVIKTVIQRIDGDTGGLWGSWNGTSYTVSHFTAAGPALYSITPRPDGTLLLKSLLADPHAPAADLVARRPAEARKASLPAPTDPTQQTTIRDPTAPLTFSFPDLTGRLVSNTDPKFRGKVVIVAVGGSWCPNCHDEAPFLVSLYKRFHSRGLEIVNLDFELGDPEIDTQRLEAFVAHYEITYPVLIAGTTDELSEKIPQGVNLNCWPTSFFIGRDGLVKQVHSGFAGPGNTVGHAALERDVTSLIEKLLADRAPNEIAAAAR